MVNESASKKSTNNSNRIKHTKNAFQKSKYHCRVCARKHPLRTCRKFLAMNIVARIQTVRQLNYCLNCLAHQHSHGTCISKSGCKLCQKQHHTLLHVNQRLKKDILGNESLSAGKQCVRASTVEPKKLESLSPSSSNKSDVSLSGLMRLNNTIILPTIVVNVKTPRGVTAVRCLLDTGLTVSRVSTKSVDAWGIPSLALGNENVCLLQVHSLHDNNVSLNVTLKVSDRLNLLTPSESIPSAVKLSFTNLKLADPEFNVRAGIEIVFGMEVWDQISIPGDIARTGLPTAKNTIFGYSICGSYHR